MPPFQLGTREQVSVVVDEFSSETEKRRVRNSRARDTQVRVSAARSCSAFIPRSHGRVPPPAAERFGAHVGRYEAAAAHPAGAAQEVRQPVSDTRGGVTRALLRRHADQHRARARISTGIETLIHVRSCIIHGHV